MLANEYNMLFPMSSIEPSKDGTIAGIIDQKYWMDFCYVKFEET